VEIATPDFGVCQKPWVLVTSSFHIKTNVDSAMTIVGAKEFAARKDMKGRDYCCVSHRPLNPVEKTGSPQPATTTTTFLIGDFMGKFSQRPEV
jgi:hypothetical protein